MGPTGPVIEHSRQQKPPIDRFRLSISLSAPAAIGSHAHTCETHLVAVMAGWLVDAATSPALLVHSTCSRCLISMCGDYGKVEKSHGSRARMRPVLFLSTMPATHALIGHARTHAPWWPSEGV